MEEKKKNWFMRHKVITAILVILILPAFLGHSSNTVQMPKITPTSGNTISPTTKTVKVEPTNIPIVRAKKLSLGDEGYLRIPNNSDQEQIIILATDKQYINDVSKALLSNDSQGYVELAQKGEAFGVHVGTQVKVIDTSVGERRVRILKGAKDVDKDKEGMSGWVAYEFVSAE